MTSVARTVLRFACKLLHRKGKDPIYETTSVAKAIQGTSLPFESIDDIGGKNCLLLCDKRSGQEPKRDQKICSIAKAIEGTSLPFESIDNIGGKDCLPLCVQVVT